MKVKALNFFLVVFIAVGFIVPVCNAQQSKSSFVFVDLVFKKERFPHEAKVPILETETKEIPDSLNDSYHFGGATVDCDSCVLSSEFEINARAFEIGSNRIKLQYRAHFKNKKNCNINLRKTLKYSDSTTKIQLKCRVELNISFYPTPKIGGAALL